MTRARTLLLVVAVVVASLTSGTLECGPPHEVAQQAHGRELYGLMCAVCHGAQGEGYKADHATALAQPEFLASAPSELWTSAITDGRWGTTMSAWGRERGGPLGKDDVEAIVAFLRARSELLPARLDESPRTGDASRGASLYARECAGCHGAQGTKGQFIGIGNPQLLSEVSDGFLRYAIGAGRPGTPMPGFRATLGNAAVEDLLALLRKWEKEPAPWLTPRAPAARTPPLPLGPVPLNPRGPEPAGFRAHPLFTSAKVIKAELDRGAKMAILDARAPSDYVVEHIPGAVSVPFYDPSPYLKSLPHDAWLVAYCGCPHAESGQLAGKLVANGFTKVTVLDEGLGYWRNMKYGTTGGIGP